MGAPAGVPPAAAAAAGPALKPRERSSEGAARAAEEAAQSAKAPESEGNLLVVATTEGVLEISRYACLYIWTHTIDRSSHSLEGRQSI